MSVFKAVSVYPQLSNLKPDQYTNLKPIIKINQSVASILNLLLMFYIAHTKALQLHSCGVIW